MVRPYAAIVDREGWMYAGVHLAFAITGDLARANFNASENDVASTGVSDTVRAVGPPLPGRVLAQRVDELVDPDVIGPV